MTIFGWDASHYDGTLTKAILTRAKSEGIAFFTHKLGEGLGGADATQASALTAAREAGILVIGGYWFLHGTNDPVAEASACIAMADAHEPWWRDFEGWVWQADSETSSTGLPSPAHVKKFADSLASRTGRKVLVYASHGMYGNRLAGLGHPLWNANYGSDKKGAFKSVYPGDKSAGWNAYSGQTPAILQFGSNATIAGLTTCDANAFRGTIDDLLTLIGANMPLTEADANFLAAHKLLPLNESWGGTAQDTRKWVDQIAHQQIPTIESTLAAIQKSLSALQNSVAAINAQVSAHAALGDTVNTLSAQVADLQKNATGTDAS